VRVPEYTGQNEDRPDHDEEDRGNSDGFHRTVIPLHQVADSLAEHRGLLGKDKPIGRYAKSKQEHADPRDLRLPESSDVGCSVPVT
jgi:hypothetical protein